MKKTSHNFLWIKLAVSLTLLLAAVYCIDMSFSGIANAISASRLSSEIRANPQLWSSEIQTLKEHKADLEKRFKKTANLIVPDLQSFSKVAGKYGLKLVGVNLRGTSPGDKIAEQSYTLIFQGELTPLLDALDFVENNMRLKIESIALGPSQTRSNNLEMSLRFSSSEKAIEAGKN
ncbi:hypothetical protein TRIP_C60010 [Candidatus Zixiibacteriota bacterium]|nr:hypothetical protein TRIP_C60010 [candidate division Zixibacteria bacterium]